MGSGRNRKTAGQKSGHSQNQHKSNSSPTTAKPSQLTSKASLSRQLSNEKRNDTNFPSIGTLFGPWSPRTSTAFKALLSARLCSAVWSNISDCDETFNYWEPSHYLIHQSGFQTWEHSPQFAIRSYFFIWLYTLPALLYTMLLQANKVLVFYFTRCILAFLCALCETYFYKGVSRVFGPNISRLVLCFLVTSSGMFISSTAFLPSSFSMYMTILLYGAWLQQHYRVVLFTAFSSMLIGWPFSAIVCAPVGLDLLLLKKRRMFFLKWGGLFVAAIAVPIIAVDSYQYGKLVLAPLNIVLYNVFTSHGANLYGVESWTFYFLNCFLNFNLVFVASITALPIMIICKLFIKTKRNIVNSSHWICLAAVYAWFGIFFVQAHKEERFIFPIYPLICLCSAFALEMVQKAINYLIPKLSYLYSLFVLTFVLIFAFLSVSRCLALYKGYHAPMDSYMELGRIHQEYNVSTLKIPINVCVGKEWHRFPNSFFLPDHRHWKLQFLKSEFRGQLPKPFSEEKRGTRIIPKHMNDRNVEEPSRYVDVSLCHFVIDTDYPSNGPRDPPYSRDVDNWEVISSFPFLDNSHSPPLWRAFYFPFITESKCSYVKYNLLRSKKLTFE